jgi:hypothetical protein
VVRIAMAGSAGATGHGGPTPQAPVATADHPAERRRAYGDLFRKHGTATVDFPDPQR